MPKKGGLGQFVGGGGGGGAGDIPMRTMESINFETFVILSLTWVKMP